MKYHITLTLDGEVILKLKTRKVNISNLVNNLLKAYTETENFKAVDLNEEELDKEWFIAKQKLLEIEQVKDKREKDLAKRSRPPVEAY